jgi:hypothetical protein
VAEALDRQELLTALTTEHSTLQSARSQTASESASRASLYILSVSSAPVALGLIGQASQIGTTFHVFALTVLPTLDVLGVFTFVRVVECGAEDFRYGVAINRIRNCAIHDEQHGRVREQRQMEHVRADRPEERSGARGHRASFARDRTVVRIADARGWMGLAGSRVPT